MTPLAASLWRPGPQVGVAVTATQPGHGPGKASMQMEPADQDKRAFIAMLPIPRRRAAVEPF
jgi:hypothetical protein